jgi:hypothetical protein
VVIQADENLFQRQNNPPVFRKRDNAMAFQPAPNVRKVAFNGVQNGVPVVNVYHVEDINSATLERLEELAIEFYDWWDEWLRPAHHTSYTLNDITVTDVAVENGIQFIYTGFPNTDGQSTGAAANGNAAAVISWRTGNIGKSFRGRTYIGGLATSAFDNAQYLSSASAAAFVVVGTALIDALTAIDAVLVVVSRFANNVARVTALATQIISVIVDTKGDSQRRRTPN